MWDMWDMWGYVGYVGYFPDTWFMRELRVMAFSQGLKTVLCNPFKEKEAGLIYVSGWAYLREFSKTALCNPFKEKEVGLICSWVGLCGLI